MLILVAKSPTTLARKYVDEHIGILASPRNVGAARLAAEIGFPWGADNDAFNGGFDEIAYVRMLNAMSGVGGCLFVAAPDVVGDAEKTLDLFDVWSSEVRSYGLPVALVAQDGMTVEDAQWWEGAYDALFIGGTTEWKESSDARYLVDEAKSVGTWVHMGRVNTVKRIAMAREWGVDSIDGTSTVMFTDTHLPWQIEVAAGRQHSRKRPERFNND